MTTALSGNTRCLKCGAEFVCGAAAGQERCWCMGLPLLARTDKDATSCYCPECLKALLSAQERA